MVDLRHVLVTGGSRGIGAAVVARALAAGYRVSFTSRTVEPSAAQSDDRSRPYPISADVRDAGRVGEVFGLAEARFGPVTHLVNNAGITGPLGRFERTDPDLLRDVFEVNFFGALAYTRHALRLWSGSGIPGVVVNISSMAARTGAPGEYVGYAASKAAIDAFTHGLASEVGPAGIRVVGVAPGTTATDIHRAAGDAERPTRVASRVPLRRVATPSEVAAAVLWAMSDEASYLTGETIALSGGL